MDDLSNRLLHFLAASDEERGELLEAWPDLISDAALQQLDAWAAASPDENSRSTVLFVREALASVREQVTASSMPPELAEILEQLTQPINPLQAHERIKLAERALGLFDRADQPELWAVVMLEYGAALASNLAGDYAANLEKAIECLHSALQIATRERMPVEFSMGMVNLGYAYRNRVQHHPADNLERAIECLSAGIQIINRNEIPAVWALAMTNLAYAHFQRIYGDRAQNQESAIECFSRVIDECSKLDMRMEKVNAMAGLGMVYSHRIRGSRSENLEQAIQLFTEALKGLTLESTPLPWGDATMNLGTAYLLRLAGDRADNIERSIECYSSAAKLFTRHRAPPHWAKLAAQLGSAYQARVRGDRSANIEKAIELYRAALEVQTQIALPADWARTTANLGITYRIRIQGSRGENIDNAIQCMTDSLKVTTRETAPVQWASVNANLANAYGDRPHGDRAENLEQAIRHSHAALEILTRDAMPLDYARTMMNLGVVMLHRIRGDRAANQEAAIECFTNALEVRARNELPVDWAVTMMNLGTVYMHRVLGGKVANLHRAIECFAGALEVITPETMPIEWAGTLMNLGSAFGQLLDGNQAAHMEKSIECFSNALGVLTPELNLLQHFTCLMNLGVAHQRRVHGNHIENLTQAIRFHSTALEVMSRDSAPFQWATNLLNLGNAYFGLFDNRRADNRTEARRCYARALEVMTDTAMPAEYVRVQRSLGLLLIEEQRWSEAAATIRAAMEINESLYRLAITSEERIGVLREVSELANALAFCVAKQGGENNISAAAAIVEAGRARWLEEALALRRTPIDELPESSKQQFIDIRNRIHALQTEARKSSEPNQRSYLAVRKDLEEAYRELNAWRSDIQLPLLEGSDTVELPAVPSHGTVLIYIIATNQGGLALLLRNASVKEIWLPLLVADVVTQKAIFLVSRPVDSVDEVTGWLWDAVIADLLPELAENDEALLIPCGLLSLLPLHAAWTPDPNSLTGRRYALDLLRLRYLPRASSTALTTAGDETESILVVDEPLPVASARLQHSKYEAAAARLSFSDGEVLTGEKATREEVLARLTQHSVWHFSCHGGVDLDVPLRSGLLMANDTWLTLRDFLELPSSRVRLAVLSACQTGIHDLKSPDEMLGLPASLLQAGAEAVVASLWPVIDVSTMMLMARFYSIWKPGNDKSPRPHLALREAQQWIRDTTNREKEDHFHAVLPELASHRMANETVQAALRHIRLQGNPDLRGFAHPYHWAAFTYTGA